MSNTTQKARILAHTVTDARNMTELAVSTSWGKHQTGSLSYGNAGPKSVQILSPAVTYKKRIVQYMYMASCDKPLIE